MNKVLNNHKSKIDVDCNLYISDVLESIRLALLENDNERENNITKVDDIHQLAISFLEKEKRNKILEIKANNEKRAAELLDLKSKIEHIKNKRLKSKQKKKLNKLLPSILMELYSDGNEDQASNVNSNHLVVEILETVVYKLKGTYDNIENSYDNMENSNDNMENSNDNMENSNDNMENSNDNMENSNVIENDNFKQLVHTLPFFMVYLVVMSLFVSYMQNKVSLVLNASPNCQNEYIWMSDLAISNSYYPNFLTSHCFINSENKIQEYEAPSLMGNSILLTEDISSEQNQVKKTKKVNNKRPTPYRPRYAERLLKYNYGKIVILESLNRQ